MMRPLQKKSLSSTSRSVERHNIKDNHSTACWMEWHIQWVATILKMHSPMKDDKNLESLTKLDDALLLIDIPWD